MRTTIELSQNHRQAIHQLAQMRGQRGYSKLIQEAVDYFLENKRFDKKEQARLLALRGSWSDEETRQIRFSMSKVHANWKKSS